jgi:hypothetical protein
MIGADQLALFCPTCTGSGVVVAEVRNHNGDAVAVPAPCPTCRPSPTRPETVAAVAALGRRLTREQPAAGR